MINLKFVAIDKYENVPLKIVRERNEPADSNRNLR